jgi:hypothetical protein
MTSVNTAALNKARSDLKALFSEINDDRYPVIQ